MDAVGVQPASLSRGGRIPMEAGSGRTAAGTGKAMSPGPGLATIMARGLKIRCMDGSGCRASNGRRHGSAGALVAAIAGGRHWRRAA